MSLWSCPPPCFDDCVDRVVPPGTPVVTAAGLGLYNAVPSAVGTHWFKVAITDTHGGVGTAVASVATSVAVFAGYDVALPFPATTTTVCACSNECRDRDRFDIRTCFQLRDLGFVSHLEPLPPPCIVRSV